MILIGPHCSRCHKMADRGHDVIDAKCGGWWCQECCNEVFGGVGGVPTKKTSEGRKDDKGKLRWSLLPGRALKEIIGALEYGAKKYDIDNWRKVEDHRRRYYDAMMRHIDAWWAGEKNDPESGLHHLAHAGACLMFLLERDEEP